MRYTNRHFTLLTYYWQTRSIARPLCNSRATCYQILLQFLTTNNHEKNRNFKALEAADWHWRVSTVNSVVYGNAKSYTVYIKFLTRLVVSKSIDLTNEKIDSTSRWFFDQLDLADFRSTLSINYTGSSSRVVHTTINQQLSLDIFFF